MSKMIDPKEFGLSSRTIIRQISKKHFTIVKERKSRVIMKDGQMVLSQAKSIWKIRPDVKISLTTSALVCSKTTAFLHEHKIKILSL